MLSIKLKKNFWMNISSLLFY